MSRLTEPYFLIKNGMYYAHNSCGYVHHPIRAEIFSETDAKSHESRSDEVSAVPLSETGMTVEFIDAHLERINALRIHLLAKGGTQ